MQRSFMDAPDYELVCGCEGRALYRGASSNGPYAYRIVQFAGRAERALEGLPCGAEPAREPDMYSLSIEHRVRGVGLQAYEGRAVHGRIRSTFDLTHQSESWLSARATIADGDLELTFMHGAEVQGHVLELWIDLDDDGVCHVGRDPGWHGVLPEQLPYDLDRRELITGFDPETGIQGASPAEDVAAEFCDTWVRCNECAVSEMRWQHSRVGEPGDLMTLHECARFERTPTDATQPSCASKYAHQLKNNNLEILSFAVADVCTVSTS
jgi:hypothetical protein